MDQKLFEGRRLMLSEKVLFALNNVDDLYLEEAEELLDKPIASRHAFNKRTLHVLLIAAVLAALLTACAVGYSIHQRRQQELRESLKIEENHVAGYQEFEKAPTPEETTVESEGKTPSVQLISTDFYIQKRKICGCLFQHCSDHQRRSLGCHWMGTKERYLRHCKQFQRTR